MTKHICPVCSCSHEVHPILDRLSYGKPRTCTPLCKTIFPALARARTLSDHQQVAAIEKIRALKKAA